MATRREWNKNRRRIKFAKNRKKYFLIGILTGALLIIGICIVIISSNSQKTPTEVPEEVAEKSEVKKPKLQLQEVKRAIGPGKEEKLIAKHTIDNPASYGNRNVNLAVCAQIINGKTNGYILLPGDKFSYIEVIGNPDIERGFKPAGEIQNGRSSTGIGGGVCQVMSTINSAIQKTKQKTDEKHLQAEHHTLPSHYIKLKRGDKEASVAYSSGRDFWFVSTLNYPIRIFLQTKGGTVNVKIYRITVSYYI